MLPIFAAPESQECSHICDILQAFQQGHKMKQIIIRRIINPPFNRYRIVLLKGQYRPTSLFKDVLTLMEHIAERAVIQNHDFAQIGLDVTEILNKCSMPISAMLSIIPP